MKRIGLVAALGVLALAGGTLMVLRRSPPPEATPSSHGPDPAGAQPAPAVAAGQNAVLSAEFHRRLEALANELGKPSGIEALVRQAAEFELRLERDEQFRKEALARLRDPATGLQTRCFLSLALLRSGTKEQRGELLRDLREADRDVLLAAFYGCAYRRSAESETLKQREEIWLGLLLKANLREIVTPKFLDVYFSERYGITVEQAMEKPLAYKLNFPQYVAHGVGIEDPEQIAEARRFILGPGDVERRNQVLLLVAENVPEAPALALEVYRSSPDSAHLKRTAANMIGLSRQPSKMDLLTSLYAQESDDEMRSHLLTLMNSQDPQAFRAMLAQKADSVDRKSQEYEVCIRALGRVNDVASLEVLKSHYDSAPGPEVRGVILDALGGPTKGPRDLEIRKSIVVRALDDPSVPLRIQALTMAKRLGPESFQSKLQSIAESDSSPIVRELAKKMISGR